MKEQDLLKEIKDRFKEAYDAVQQNYSESIDDTKFYNGEQWDSAVKADRATDGRPTFIINKIPTFCDQVIGDRPSKFWITSRVGLDQPY